MTLREELACIAEAEAREIAAHPDAPPAEYLRPQDNRHRSIMMWTWARRDVVTWLDAHARHRAGEHERLRALAARLRGEAP